MSDWIISSSLSSSSRWLVETIFTERSLKIAPTLIPDSQMKCLTSDHDIMITQTLNPMGLELTRSLTPSEFNDSSQGPSLLGQQFIAVFVFSSQSSNQTFLSGHTPYCPSYDIHLARKGRIVGTQDLF